MIRRIVTHASLNGVPWRILWFKADERAEPIELIVGTEVVADGVRLRAWLTSPKAHGPFTPQQRWRIVESVEVTEAYTIMRDLGHTGVVATLHWAPSGTPIGLRCDTYQATSEEMGSLLDTSNQHPGRSSSMRKAEREALAAVFEGWVGQEVFVSLRFPGTIAVAPGTLGQGPLSIEGTLERSDAYTAVLHGRADGPSGAATKEQVVLLNDVLMAAAIGQVAAPRLIRS